MKRTGFIVVAGVLLKVAFTPKGGCQLKHPPCWVGMHAIPKPVAFTPKGGCQLKRCAKRACLVEVLLW